MLPDLPNRPRHFRHALCYPGRVITTNCPTADMEEVITIGLAALRRPRLPLRSLRSDPFWNLGGGGGVPAARAKSHLGIVADLKLITSGLMSRGAKELLGSCRM